ncbi:MAG: ATP-dependent DNA helicase RecG [Parcubacteria group bacterium Gr01-1014_13]|nr:MAG: ATP-dependent DNA helicase RecG [Parcubacteria group bacterium Gr01-1014_13]
MDFKTRVAELGGVGKKTFKKFEYLGVKTAKDLLYYFPFRYEDYRKIVPIAQLQAGELVTICGQVELIASKKSFRSRKTITEALVSDKSGSVRIVWFNQPFITKNIHVGDILYLSGKAQADMLGPKLTSPIYEKYKKEGSTHTARLVPIYPTTHGLTQKQIRFLISHVMGLAAKIKEWLPANILEQADLIPFSSALYGIHFPTDDNDLKLSTDRLKFDELFLIQLRAELARQEKSTLQAPPISFKEDKIKEFVSSLPFTLTKSQKISAWEILQDIAKTKPMNRLVSGDVGSGKTVVAAIAIYNAFLNGYQAAMMAPTEILAQQHYQSLQKLFSKLNIRVGLLTGSQTGKLKKEIVADINDGKIDVVVGTHALLVENVSFYKLGLVVVDEQHRFGVEQRKLIKQKGLGAHFLSMTATPIPRSLALMIYGDLDVSIINEMPPGRKKIITKMVEPAKREKAYQFIHDQVKLGRQVFVICSLIEQKDEAEIEIINYSANPTNEKKSVLSEYEKLSQKVFPDLKVGYLHGKLKPTEKDKVMDEFKNKKIDILVSTSVVEVGVDIPNASVMMIEGAESFGLAQLHQFRGRVGRSSHQSYCLLFSSSSSQKSSERLKYFESNSDGFKLAQKDLEIRGPGEVYGTEQSGEMNLRLAKLSDRELINKAREAAKTIVLNPDKYSQVMKIVKDWEGQVHLE